jgi:hypothetical protein
MKRTLIIGRICSQIFFFDADYCFFLFSKK